MELKGKVFNFIGDSITQGVGTTSEDKIYLNVLKEKAGLKAANNYGSSGTKIARLKVITDDPFDQDFNLRAPNMDITADGVVVFGGTNDFGHGTIPLGDFESRDVHTFYGALHELCLYLIKTYVDKPIVFMTPIHRLNEVLDYETRKKEGNPNARPLIDFVNAIREVCEFYSIPVLDLYKDSGMHGTVWVWCEKYMPDGLHPSDFGNAVIAEKLQKFLENL